MHIEETSKKNIRLKTWHKVVFAMSCLVVFITVYALTMPAVTKEGAVFCGKEEHIHTEECIPDRQLVCELEETGHIHSDECRIVDRTLICELPELPAHAHSEDCYRFLGCGLEETEGHLHGDGCYDAEGSFICQLEEVNPHTHGGECWGVSEAPLCGLEETEGHTHGEDCWHEEITVTCELEEDIEGHVHSEDCWETNYSCGFEGHEHSLACYSDPSDVEYYDLWERSVSSYELTGSWPDDLVGIARTQLGTGESGTNYLVDPDGGTHGYTRYGGWYGAPYEEWCAMFVSFCLHFAEVPTDVVPMAGGCPYWTGILGELGMIARPDAYTPKPGDLIFYDFNDRVDADHVGIVVSVDVPNGMLTTIEGNGENGRVDLYDYELTDWRIMCYGVMPQNPDYIEEPDYTRTYTGADYSVTVGYSEAAKIPEEAELVVSEYTKDDPTYMARYAEAAAAYGWSEGVDYSAYFRLFNIGFTLNGEEFEPSAAVLVSISLPGEDRNYVWEYWITHFADEATEQISASSAETEDGTLVSFKTGSLSDFGVAMFALPRPSTLSVELEDYIVSVSWPDGVECPAGSVLSVSLISEESELYQTRVEEATEFLGLSTYLMIKPYFKVFDIELTVDGVPVELDDTVTVKVTYKGRANGLEDTDEVAVFAYGEETEILDAIVELEGSDESLYMETTYVSDLGILCMSEEEARKAMKETLYGTAQLPSDIPAAGSFIGTHVDYPQPGKWYMIYGWYDNGTSRTTKDDKYYALVANGVSNDEIRVTQINQGSIKYDSVLYTGTEDLLWYYDGSGFINRNGNYLCTALKDWDSPYYINARDDVIQRTSLWLNPTDLDGESKNAIEYQQGTKTLSIWKYHYRNGDGQRMEGPIYCVLTMPNNGSNAFVDMNSSQKQMNGYLPIYVAEYVKQSEGDVGGYPKAAETQYYDVQGVFLFNVDANKSMAQPLAGVKYTVYDSNKNVVGVYTTNNSYVLQLGGLQKGATYTIKQTAVPEGYIVSPQETSFTVPNGNGKACAGIFYDYKATEYGKTKEAQVYNYADRIYDIRLTAASGGLLGEVQSANYNFVLDQSNSMLFPAVLTEFTEAIIVTDNTKHTVNNVDYEMSGNSKRIQDAITNAGGSTDGLYYAIGDPTTTATVYALWQSSNKAERHGTEPMWYCQDASSYLKVQEKDPKYGNYSDVGNDGTQWLSSGGPMNGWWQIKNNVKQKFYVSGITNGAEQIESGLVRMKIYTGSEMTRLTYLIQAVKETVYMLNSLNVDNKVTISGFNSEVTGCIERTIGKNRTTEVNDLIDYINKISTDGGTAQEWGLQHVYGAHAGTGDAAHTTNHIPSGKNNITILITDGALNNLTNGNYSDQAAMEKAFTDAGAEVRKTSKLVTVALSSKEVSLAQTLLAETPKGVASPGLAYLDINASQLSTTLAEAILGELVKFTSYSQNATMEDVISDSFYLVDKNGTTLNDGDWIDKDGNKVSSSNSNAAAKIVKGNDGWHVEWKQFSLEPNKEKNFHVFVKAKEDFIGGNTIDTNKSCTINLLETSTKTGKPKLPALSFDLETPTVNVHLLNMNNVSSEETVFLSDKVENLNTKLRALYDELEVQKILSNGDNIHNKKTADNVEHFADSFKLSYAYRDLTANEWNELFKGNAVEIPYTYDSASSHGSVGKFVISVTKSGSADVKDHFTDQSGLQVEKYVLKVEYVADRITGEGATRTANVHNFGYGPGTEVGTETASETGNNTANGKVTSTNVHVVNVVDGKVTVKKSIDATLTGTYPQTYNFTLYKDSGQVDTNNDPIYSKIKDFSITLQSGTEASYTIENLPRGNYKIVEQKDDEYHVDKAEKIVSDTNCLTDEQTDIIFHIGTYADNSNVILKNSGTGYQSVYSWAVDKDGNKINPLTSTNVYGVSYGAEKITNTKTVYTGELPVRKIWSAASADFKNKVVYIVLCDSNGIPVDFGGECLVLALTEDNLDPNDATKTQWVDKLLVPLDDKNDTIAKHGYTIREVSGAAQIASTDIPGSGYYKGKVQNATSKTFDYITFQNCYESGTVMIGSVGFDVTITDDPSVTDGKIVKNAKAYTLPESGGPGTYLFMISGVILVVLSACIFGLSMRRKSGRRYE